MSVTLLQRNPAPSGGESMPNGTESNKERETHPYESNDKSSRRKGKQFTDEVPNGEVRKNQETERNTQLSFTRRSLGRR